MTEQAMNLLNRYFPDTAKAKNMVYAVCIEIFSHLTKSVDPPTAVVFQHDIPVICWESPVLSVGRESVRRSTCLSVKIEIEWFYPCLHTVTADTYRYVTLQHDTFLTCVCTCLAHLRVENELYKIIY